MAGGGKPLHQRRTRFSPETVAGAEKAREAPPARRAPLTLSRGLRRPSDQECTPLARPAASPLSPSVSGSRCGNILFSLP
eukprot:1822090-Pyramimonas_sp.AAC.3